MSTISKKLSGFMFNGSSLALGTAAFKSSLNSVIGFNAAGTGYISYNPANAFNSLTQLAQDGVYIVDAKTPGFDIPGAILTATVPTTTPPAAPELSLDYFTVDNRQPTASSGFTTVDINFTLTSTNPDDTYCNTIFYTNNGGFSDGYGSYFIDYINPSVRTIGINAKIGDTVSVMFVSNTGNILVKSFVA